MNQQDKTFLIIFTAMIGGLTVIALLVFMIARTVTGVAERNASIRLVEEKALFDRIRPVGTVAIAGQLVEEAAADTGEAIQAAAEAGAAPADADAPAETVGDVAAVDAGALYGQACAACHDTGAANAPKKGDQTAWADRVGKGMDTLVQHAINGFNTMPAKGGAMHLSDAEVTAIVEYMVEESQ